MAKENAKQTFVVNADNAADTVLLDPSHSVTSDSLQSITQNMAPAVRHDTMEGRQYMVVPMVMLTEGVHAGSNGPLYYPKEELAKTPVVWNHKPVVVYHPTMNGQAVSACEPAVISRRKVGLIMNTRYEPGAKGQPGKLRAEAWLETNRLNEVDDRVMTAIKSGKMVEVSTGLFTDNEQTEGLWRKERYSAVARNYRPDHLAILPDEKGACSIADGAGLLRNNLHLGDNDMSKQKLVDAIITNGATSWDESDRDFLMKQEEGILEKMQPVANEIPPQFKKKEEDPEEEDPEEDPKKKEDKPADEKTCNQAQAPQTLEEYINNAPAAMRDVLVSGLRAHNAEKGKLISTITANKANRFTGEYLATKDLQELQAIAALATSVQPPTKPLINQFIGQGEVGGGQTQNASEQEPLPIPVMNFSKVS